MSRETMQNARRLDAIAHWMIGMNRIAIVEVAITRCSSTGC